MAAEIAMLLRYRLTLKGVIARQVVTSLMQKGHLLLPQVLTHMLKDRSQQRVAIIHMRKVETHKQVEVIHTPKVIPR